MILNTVNGKMYVGKTDNPSFRYADHIRVAKGGLEKYPTKYQLIHKAISKYGSDCFEHRIIQFFVSEDDAFKSEIYWIEFYKTCLFKYPKGLGYNLTTGGEGRSGIPLSEETKKKLSEAQKGKIPSEYVLNLLKTMNVGRKHSVETKNKMSVARAGKTYRSGYHLSDETKKKLSDAQLGELNHNFGKIYSDAEKKEMSEKSHFSVLTPELVKEIRELHKSGCLQKDLATKFNVKPNTISRIVNYKIWKFI